ncbi:tRNA (guanine-N(7)-)-methyltransferase [endosymbiont of Acanthamoeba sp. UWC8]|uniref:tRNA (guanosine(46)-N7)-methyltransferase TrmB n=1 Tax=endosymbiont of Acanthamoeba sp. UWC8 TaxID=86106 RepID=UPI0004D0BB3A|nr:tRNA (guanosine(46)-N7)-methyltransferase TrmB [endosymbiont of Acanthamoeba sp. UWC8]AIF81350.1 tRNA (guanine-N(7)-)-methyltransferase [endosymbiont of Acanthamoeba sp. UWC8]
MNQEKKYLSSFARRISRKLSPYQKELLDQFLPLVLFNGENFENVLKNYTRAKFEIGFGNGDHILAQAIKNPKTLFIGCEPYLNGVTKVLDEIKNQGLKNILLYPDDARNALEIIEVGVLQTVYILFPDPWPKNKQKKRRVINKETLSMIHEKLCNTGELIIATDHKDYAQSILKDIEEIDLFKFNDENFDIYEQPEYWVKTKYETKALAGRSHYILLVKK